MMTMMAGGGGSLLGLCGSRCSCWRRARPASPLWLGGEACGREVRPWQRLFGQMVMWRKTGDRFAVGKKARPMGARQAHAKKQGQPLAQPFGLLCPLLLAWCSSRGVCSRLEFFALMVMWRKAGNPFPSAKKGDQWVRGGKRARPTPAAGLVGLLGGGGGQRGVCSRLSFWVQMVMWRKSRRPHSVGKKARPMGARRSKGAKKQGQPLAAAPLPWEPWSTSSGGGFLKVVERVRTVDNGASTVNRSRRDKSGSRRRQSEERSR